MYANIYVFWSEKYTSVKEEEKKSVSCFVAIRKVSSQSLFIDKQFVTIRWWKYVKINYRIVIFAFIIRRRRWRRRRRWYPNRLFINISLYFEFVSSGVATRRLQIGFHKATSYYHDGSFSHFFFLLLRYWIAILLRRNHFVWRWTAWSRRNQMQNLF